jgi:hypothetical protein
VAPESITKHFGLAYKKQLLRSPFYGVGQGMTSEEWWKEVISGNEPSWVDRPLIQTSLLSLSLSLSLVSWSMTPFWKLVCQSKVRKEMITCWGHWLICSEKDLDSKFSSLFPSLYTRFMTKEGYTIFPDVVSTLDELQRRGFKMGVISNSDERLRKLNKICRGRLDFLIICFK